MNDKIKQILKDSKVTLQGNKEYVTAQGRIKAFREMYPEGLIKTEHIVIDPVKEHATFKATVLSAEGDPLAYGYGSASQAQASKAWSGRWVEKAETAAMARALGVFFSFFSDDDMFDDGDHLAETPKTPAEKRKTLLTIANARGVVAITKITRKAEHYVLDSQYGPVLIKDINDLSDQLVEELAVDQALDVSFEVHVFVKTGGKDNKPFVFVDPYLTLCAWSKEE